MSKHFPQKTKFSFLEPYFDPVLRRRLKQRGINHVPIPKELQWKALVLVMRSGEWVTISYIQMETGFKRKRVRMLMYEGMRKGIIERTTEKYSVLVTKDRWKVDEHVKGRPLPRKINFYRLNMEKIQVEVSEDD